MIHLHHHDRDVEDPWLRDRLAMLPAGARILDVGCVDGWVLDEYLAWGADCRPCPAKWAQTGRFWQGDAESMPYPTGLTDAVTCVSVLEHVGLGWYGDPEGDEGKAGRIVAEMARVLRPGGWLFLTVPLALTMTKDGRPFARPVDTYTVTAWVAKAGLTIREQLHVETDGWIQALGDDANPWRNVVLISAQKPEAA